MKQIGDLIIQVLASIGFVVVFAFVIIHLSGLNIRCISGSELSPMLSNGVALCALYR